MPVVSSGVLWPDQANKLFYLYGGEYSSTTEVQSFETLWFYDTFRQTWNRSRFGALDQGTNPITWPASGAGTVDDDGVAYYYGGYLNNKTMPGWSGGAQMMNSLVAFDMNKNTWYNRTIDEVPRAEGSLHYIAAGKQGSLIYLGGVEQVAGQRQYVSLSEMGHGAR